MDGVDRVDRKEAPGWRLDKAAARQIAGDFAGAGRVKHVLQVGPTQRA
jgi:hypothetical protein